MTLSNVERILLTTPIPVVTATIAAAVAVRRRPSLQIQSGVQHFAAGLVFATAATELVPDLVREHSSTAVLIGFALGIALMLGVDYFPKRFLASATADSAVAMLTAIGIDVFLDGILIGIGFVEGGKVGPLLAVALSVELTFLGMAVTAQMRGSGRSNARVIATTTLIASPLIVGGLLAVTLLGNLHGAPLSVILSVGTVALLYLVTEELLVEAHERADTPILTAMFFVGFLVILLLSFSV